jgi:hypothetical protein
MPEGVSEEGPSAEGLAMAITMVFQAEDEAMERFWEIERGLGLFVLAHQNVLGGYFFTHPTEHPCGKMHAMRYMGSGMCYSGYIAEKQAAFF